MLVAETVAVLAMVQGAERAAAIIIYIYLLNKQQSSSGVDGCKKPVAWQWQWCQHSEC